MPSPRYLPLAALTLLLAAGCGDDEAEDGGGGGEGGGGGATTAVTAGPPSASVGAADEGSLAALTAPTQTTIRTTWPGLVAPPLTMESYVVDSDRGPLAVVGLEVDTATGTLTVTTTPQKLGVTYTLSIAAPDSPFDGYRGEFLAADTVELWATEFDGFSDYRVKAQRVTVGDHAVLYVEEGLFAGDADFTRDVFDDTIFPVEQELFRDPPDDDGNGRIVLLGLDGRDWYGGYFNPLNTMTEAEAQGYGSHSNEMEIIYFNVAYMGGFNPTNVVPHEYLHLLYAEEHGALDGWNWHNEGMAECAVTAVWGGNEQSEQFYVQDPQEDLRRGKSLVNWEYANYSQYAQAYVFLSYVAGQLGGLDGYGDLFHAPGDPRLLEDLLEERLGASFAETQLNALAAAWLQEESGPYGFAGLIDLPGRPQVAPAAELSLRPFAGAFFGVGEPVVAPVGAGADVLHLGLGADGARDDASPFEVPDGVVIALNGRMDPSGGAGESSGVLEAPPAPEGGATPRSLVRDLSWLHAPPLPPSHPGLRRFRELTRVAR